MKNIVKISFLLISLSIFAQQNNLKEHYIEQESIIKVKLNDIPDLRISDWIINIPENKSLKNKFILINFWKSELNPNLFNMEYLNQLQSKLNDKNLYFVTLTNEKPDLVVKSLKKYNVKTNSIVVSDQRKFNSFWTGGIETLTLPISILIDNYGTVKWIGLPNDLDEKILKNLILGKLEPYDVYSRIRK